MGCGGELTPSGAPRPLLLGTRPPSERAAGVPSVRAAPAERLASVGERKQITALFCDLVNSVGITERLGSERFVALLNRFLELVLAEVQRYDGTIDNFRGDGFLALFGAPVAHEDHARRAVLAALGIRRRMEEQGSALGVQYGVELAVRMGLNTGPVVVGTIGADLAMDYTAIGDTTNVAARLQQMAEPRAIIISEATARHVAGYARVEAIGTVEVRGRSEPIAAYRVLGIGPRRAPLEGLAPRTLSQFVGRARQLADLKALLEQIEQGRGQAVGIAAEPGMGKSRLIYEFRRSLGRKRVTYLEGRCLSYGSAIPYVPILDIIRNNCGIAEADSPDVVAEKVRFALQEVEMDPRESLPYVMRLFGIDVGESVDRLAVLSPEAIKARTFEVLRQMCLRGSRRRPIVFVVEDLHWIDKTSEEYFTSLVESFAGSAIMLICSYRPRYLPPWMDQSYSMQITLQRLATDDALSIVRSVLKTEEVPPPLARTILDRAEGNPFFLEELSKAVAEHDDFRSEIAVPDTVQGVLAARMDRLSEAPRRVLQTAAVLGREFSLRLLGAIWEGPGVIEPYLLELKRLEFVYEQTEASEPTYVFKHALTQDVAYESLLTSHRRALHAAAGRALEALYADRLEDVYDRLAYHYARTDDAPKAVEYLTRFAEITARSYANADAVRILEEALTHAARLPPQDQDRWVPDITNRLARSLYFLGRVPDTLDLLLREQARVERLQDPHLAGPFYFWLAHTYSYLSDLDHAAEYAQRAVDEAARCGDDVTLGMAHYVLARRGFLACEFVDGVEHGQRAVALLERTDQTLWLGQSYWVIGFNQELMGQFDAALGAAERARLVGEMRGDIRIQTYAGWLRGWILTTRGDWEHGVDACRWSLDRSRDTFNTAAATGWLGLALLEKDDPAEAVPRLEFGSEELARTRYWTIKGFFDVWLAEALRRAGQSQRAERVATEAQALGREIRSPYVVAWADRILGEIALTEGNLAEAEQRLAESHATFKAISSRFEAGRSCLSLAGLAHARRDAATAEAHLAAAHATFMSLRSPRYAEKTERLAETYRVPLPQAHRDVAPS
jgi:class 3 adenylate cyclase/tetratricopeptide (TPR) repeat protein